MFLNSLTFKFSPFFIKFAVMMLLITFYALKEKINEKNLIEEIIRAIKTIKKIDFFKDRKI